MQDRLDLNLLAKDLYLHSINIFPAVSPLQASINPGDHQPPQYQTETTS